MIKTFLLLSVAAFSLNAGSYETDFEKPLAGKHWSETKISATPLGGRKFLGPFGPGQIKFKLDTKTEHKGLKISFDLMLMHSWDGTGPWGPDIWDLSLEDGPKLIHSTFNNCGFICANDKQSFPDIYSPKLLYKSGTGASEKRTLGYKWQDSTVDSVYHFEFIIPHSAHELKLNFSNLSQDPITDQTWGLDNVKIELLGQLPELKDFESLWSGLYSKDPQKAFAASWKLIASGNSCLPLIRAKTANSSSDIEALIDLLNASQFKERRQARLALIKLGSPIYPLIEKRLTQIQATEQPELHYQLTRLLKSIKPPQASNISKELFNQRLRHVLRVINTAEAKKLLAEISSMQAPKTQ